MLKYLYSKVVFLEVPNEIALGISISGCKIRCSECHSKELWEDKGTPLTTKEVEKLLKENKGVTCLLLLGGEHDINTLMSLFEHFHPVIKTAWYCGLESIPEHYRRIISYLDYYKVGRYDKNLGGLDSPTTNQRLYKLAHMGSAYWETDITNLLQKKEK